MPSPATAADPRSDYIQYLTPNPTSPAASLVYGAILFYVVLLYFNNSFPFPQQLTYVWDAAVHLIPQQLLLSRDQRYELRAQGMLSQTHVAKKEVIRGMLGMGGSSILAKLPVGASEGIDIMRRASTSIFSRPNVQSDMPAGLGNWDNSCYQNAVLQGLASLASLRPYLDSFDREKSKDSTSLSLLETVKKLTDATNNGQQLWTPAKLKSMSSWQQQDAQEYYSKILDEIDKEASAAQKALVTASRPGLESLAEVSHEHKVESGPRQDDTTERSPLDGLLAQKVACTRCGFSEGLSMIPFNCLTLPLPLGCSVTGIEQCLDEYTKREEISGVECAKCTLVHAEQQLTKMLPANPGHHSCDEAPTKGELDAKALQLPPELRAQAFKRLAAIQTALERDDFAEKTLQESCQLGRKARVSTTKTKEAVVARPPQCLVMHVNRSVFDEQTGMQRKNYARVQYPLSLDLTPWMLDDSAEDGTEDDEILLYRLKAVVTHYGRHENGHYICYRQHPARRKSFDAVEDDVDVDADALDEQIQPSNTDPWYRLSDEDVSPVDEENVLGQGGVFMLFYERESLPPTLPVKESTAVIEEAMITTTESEIQVQDEEAALVVDQAAPTSADEGTHAEATARTSSSFPTSQFEDSVLPSASGQSTTENVILEDGPVGKEQEELQKSSSTAPSLRMRTARLPVVESEFAGNAFRAVAAT